MSSLAWIDFDEAERQRAQRIMALFQNVRAVTNWDSVLFATLSPIICFPEPARSRRDCATCSSSHGYCEWLRIVTVLQASSWQTPAGLKSGLRTLLRRGARRKASSAAMPAHSFSASPVRSIGQVLGHGAIRLFSGSIDSYFSSLRTIRRGWQRVRQGEEGATDAHVTHIWHPALPAVPNGLLENAEFNLTVDEAQFIIDRLVAEEPQSLLTTLAQNGIDADCRYIWEHPNLADFPAAARCLVKHGEIFSSVMHGAALIYNLQLSQLRERDQWIVHYETRLQEWSAEVDLSAVRAWSLDDFWKTVEHPAHNIRLTAKRFVAEWLDFVRDRPSGVSRSLAARRLIEERERRLKTSQSRFSNRAVRDRWGGASGRERLSFRWSQAIAHLRDLAHAE